MAESNFEGAGQRPPQTEEQIKLAGEAAEYMHDVIDPELGINVVDLGLVYDLWIEEEDDATKAIINMTLTSPACPLTDVIEDQTTTAITANTDVDEVVINWVWMPPWGPQMITEEGREQLRALGFAV
ncbi:metal-sulfur cluster assembly factor [Corynebacterium sanguinis]|uniref:Metal-sulfur cluster assembly factor n=1 Tax=Corynebacterium sanguinis TaxID=2594913 RepID=A0A6C1U2J6_9CORY|nr:MULTISPECIES: metal-sulfur cluster assembly factor [Corynebacterium]MBA4505562.1 metal-sulfur cluster assembly factor [Corynebacterium sanguinis]MCT1411160.1 metal-sulfur cluster assembly factor [Corynebacterium sanguinis]MCT1414699.1 metal-sulfur cluster assembly factor [Corynebacterium sanguinis]MCT1425629.1 metal-sulfur cluster assembly factor [Corynebacterium sanguinis]MCT1444755.1 metal-sulfur cluster assembly factor [Corynebacterium sanguinis]